jgi:HNH endonuclease
VPVLEDAAGTPLDVGRKTRVIPTAIRRALIARDESCRFPSCTNRLYTDAHHIVHWVDGGATSLSNIALLCSTHHTLVHEGGFRAIGDGNDVRFFAPTGVEIGPAGIPPKTPLDLVPVTAASTVWDSEPVDYDTTVWCLAAPDY